MEKAGFTVASFVATILVNNIQVINGQPVTIEDKTFLFVNVKDQSLNGVTKVKVLDKGFVSPKESKKNAFPVLSPRTYHATI